MRSSNLLRVFSLAVADRTRSHVVEVIGEAWNIACVSARVHSSMSRCCGSSCSNAAATSSGRSIISAGSAG